MDIKIWYHSFENTEENHIKEIAVLTDMPNEISISCEMMWGISIRPNRIIVTIREMPFRIDYDKYLNTLHIFNEADSLTHHKPYSLLSKKPEVAVTLWEYGERELANFEEGCVLAV